MKYWLLKRAKGYFFNIYLSKVRKSGERYIFTFEVFDGRVSSR
jgi:hypothetical protein